MAIRTSRHDVTSGPSTTAAKSGRTANADTWTLSGNGAPTESIPRSRPRTFSEAAVWSTAARPAGLYQAAPGPAVRARYAPASCASARPTKTRSKFGVTRLAGRSSRVDCAEAAPATVAPRSSARSLECFIEAEIEAVLAFLP